MSHISERVAVIITHHLNECDELLSLASHSVQAQGLNIPVWVVSDAPKRPEQVHGTLHHDPNVGPASQKGAFAIRELVPRTFTHFLCMSDDVILTENFFQALEPFLDHDMLILNPASNQDEGIRYNLHRFIESGERRIPLHPSMDFAQMRFHVHAIFSQIKPELRFLGPSPILWQAWVPFFCTLLPRRVYELMGPPDPRLEYRHNDEDYCLRAAQHGIRTGVVLGAYAFHFGSQTISRMPDIAQEQEAASRHFRTKSGLR